MRACPRCHESTRHFLCPRCGTRTNDAEAPAPATGRPAVELTGAYSLWAGVFVGLLLSQGLYYALRHLVNAALLAAGSPAEEAEFWTHVYGSIVQQSLQAGALLIGGMVATAGQRHGLMIGAGLGLANAALLIGFPMLIGSTPPEWVLYGVPVLHVVVGAAAGFLGGRIWQPAPDLPLLGDPEKLGEQLTTALPDQVEAVETEHVPWPRIIIGAGVAVGGTLGARLIRDLVLMASGGTAVSGSYEVLRSQFYVWGIAVVFQIAGGGIAGMNTRSGAVYGFWAGLLAAVVQTLVQALGDLSLRIHEFPAGLLGLSAAEGSPAALLIQGVHIAIVAALGGWLGSQILPVFQPKSAVNPGAD